MNEEVRTGRKMYMPRDFFLQTTNGVTCKFERNKPVIVHPLAIEDAIANGAVFVDGEAFNPDEGKEKEPEELFGFEREEAIFKACQRLAHKSDPDDFTANGIPTLKAAKREVGFDVDRREVDAVWRKVLAARANAE